MPISDAASADLLRRHGVRVTFQRVAVLDSVHHHPHAVTDEVIEATRATLGSISRQSVYDTLSLLVEHGLIRRIQPTGSVARYETRTGDNHHHLVCRGCGVVFDIDCAVGHTPCLVAEDDHGFVIDEAEVVYWGQCPDCQTP